MTRRPPPLGLAVGAKLGVEVTVSTKTTGGEIVSLPGISQPTEAERPT
jgi:hypothetical protein